MFYFYKEGLSALDGKELDNASSKPIVAPSSAPPSAPPPIQPRRRSSYNLGSDDSPSGKEVAEELKNSLAQGEGNGGNEGEKVKFAPINGQSIDPPSKGSDVVAEREAEFFAKNLQKKDEEAEEKAKMLASMSEEQREKYLKEEQEKADHEALKAKHLQRISVASAGGKKIGGGGGRGRGRGRGGRGH
jgi:hypothetical protein